MCCRREPVNQQIRQYSNACCSYASYWEASVIDGHLPQLMLRLLLRRLLPAHNTYVVWRSGNIPRNSSAADSQSAPVQRLNYKWCLCSEGCISWLLTACLIQSQQLVRCRVASHIALIKNPSKLWRFRTIVRLRVMQGVARNNKIAGQLGAPERNPNIKFEHI